MKKKRERIEREKDHLVGFLFAVFIAVTDIGAPKKEEFLANKSTENER